MHFVTQYNYKGGKKEEFTLPSMTIPDQTMSIPEIMERYVKGLPLSAGRVPVYEGEDDDLPDMSRMNKIDRIETVRQLEDELSDLKIRLSQKPKKVEKTEPEPVEVIEPEPPKA